MSGTTGRPRLASLLVLGAALGIAGCADRTGDESVDSLGGGETGSSEGDSGSGDGDGGDDDVGCDGDDDCDVGWDGKGGCAGGACLPVWFHDQGKACWEVQLDVACDSLCEERGTTCQQDACDGATVLLVEAQDDGFGFGSTTCDLDEAWSHQTWSGSCETSLAAVSEELGLVNDYGANKGWWGACCCAG